MAGVARSGGGDVGGAGVALAQAFSTAALVQAVVAGRTRNGADRSVTHLSGTGPFAEAGGAAAAVAAFAGGGADRDMVNATPYAATGGADVTAVVTSGAGGACNRRMIHLIDRLE